MISGLVAQSLYVYFLFFLFLDNTNLNFDWKLWWPFLTCSIEYVATAPTLNNESYEHVVPQAKGTFPELERAFLFHLQVYANDTANAGCLEWTAHWTDSNPDYVSLCLLLLSHKVMVILVAVCTWENKSMKQDERWMMCNFETSHSAKHSLRWHGHRVHYSLTNLFQGYFQIVQLCFILHCSIIVSNFLVHVNQDIVDEYIHRIWWELIFHEQTELPLDTK